MMTPRSRKPVLLVSGTNINHLSSEAKSGRNIMDKVSEESLPMQMAPATPVNLKSTNDQHSPAEEDRSGKEQTSLTSTFREYLNSRSQLAATKESAENHSFVSRTDDYSSTNLHLSVEKLSASLLHCLDGNEPPAKEGEQEDDDAQDSYNEKKLVLKPKQFDENGQPTVYETSF